LTTPLDARAPAHAVTAFQEHGGDRKRTLVFAPTVRVATAMAEPFQSSGIAAESLASMAEFSRRRHARRSRATSTTPRCGQRRHAANHDRAREESTRSHRQIAQAQAPQLGRVAARRQGRVLPRADCRASTITGAAVRYNLALCAVANRLVGVLHACLMAGAWRTSQLVFA